MAERFKFTLPYLVTSFWFLSQMFWYPLVVVTGKWNFYFLLRDVYVFWTCYRNIYISLTYQLLTWEELQVSYYNSCDYGSLPARQGKGWHYDTYWPHDGNQNMTRADYHGHRIPIENFSLHITISSQVWHLVFSMVNFNDLFFNW